MELTEKELYWAELETQYRIRESIRQKLRGVAKCVRRYWPEVAGAAGELAAARFFGVSWSALFFRGPDVGERTQIRSSNIPRSRSHLIIRPRDMTLYGDVPFVLVIQEKNLFCFKGWCMSSEAYVKGRYWDGGNGRPEAWFIPEDALYPIDTLENP